MPTRIDNLTPYAAELLDFGGAAPTAGKGLVWDGEGKLVAADVVVQSDLSDYATISSVTSALATKADASALSAHTAATDNPHEVTAAQVGAYTTTQVDGLISAITYSDVGAAAAVHTHEASAITDFASAVATHPDVAANTAARHVQNTDTGTNQGSFVISGSSVQVALVAEAGNALRVTKNVGGDLANVRVAGLSCGTGLFSTATYGEFGVTISNLAGSMTLGSSELTFSNHASGVGTVNAGEITEHGQPLRERYTRHFLNLESKSDLATLDATIGDQATVQTGDANDPIHRYELMGDDLDGGAYATPAENLANWRRIVTLDADGEIKGPILNRFVLDTDDTDVARIGEIVCVVDDLDNPTTASYRMGDGTTKTANLPEIATATP